MDCQRKDGKNYDRLRVELKSLKRYSNKLNSTAGEGMTLLHLAAKAGNKMLTNYFIEEGCFMNVQTSSGITPLVTAIESGHFEIAEILLRANAQLPTSYDSVEGAFYMILTHILQVPPYVCKQFYEAMRSIKTLIEIVALIEQMQCPLLGVVAMQDAELTEAILERSILNFNKADASGSVDVAVKLLDVANVEALMHYGHRFQDERIDRFIECIKEIAFGGKENLKLLTVFAEKMHGWNIWHLGSAKIFGEIFEQADVDVLKLFLQYDIVEQIRDNHGYDIRAHCFGNTNSEVMNFVKKLVADGCSPGLGIGGKCGLHFAMKACICKNITITWNWLNIRDEMGRTPIFEAFNLNKNIHERTKSVINLLIKGANVQVFDKLELNFLDFVGTKEDWIIAQSILAHLAMCESRGDLVNQRIRLKINNTELFANFYAKCHEQLEEMKKSRLCVGVSAYTFITQDFNKSVKYIRNEALKLLKDETYLAKFDIYYVMRFTFIASFLELLNNGRNNLSAIICECCEILAPYPFIVDGIMNHLSIEYVASFA